jgi:hypothetical protein
MEFHRACMVQMAGAPAQPIPIGIGKVRDDPDWGCSMRIDQTSGHEIS